MTDKGDLVGLAVVATGVTPMSARARADFDQLMALHGHLLADDAVVRHLAATGALPVDDELRAPVVRSYTPGRRERTRTGPVIRRVARYIAARARGVGEQEAARVVAAGEGDGIQPRTVRQSRKRLRDVVARHR